MNRLVLADNVTWMREAAEDPDIAGQVDLAYMDPPFNTGGVFYVGTASGGRARGEREAYRDVRKPPEYAVFARQVLTAMKPLLAVNASVFVHIDARTVHVWRTALDEVFGPKGFVNEIIWAYRTGGVARRRYPAKHDTILWYANGPGYVFHPEAVAVPSERRNHMRRAVSADGSAVRTIRSNGKVYEYPEDAGACPTDVWTDISPLNQRDPERVGYATQKPLALLTRIIAGSSEPGDLVLDPFCGSGTTLVAAHRLGRRWIGVDSSEEAIRIAEGRLKIKD